MLTLMPARFYLCGNRAGLLNIDPRRSLTHVWATGVNKNVGSCLRRLKRHDNTSVGFRLRRDLNANQAQSPNRIPLPHLEPDRLVRLRYDAGHHDERENTAE